MRYLRHFAAGFSTVVFSAMVGGCASLLDIEEASCAPGLEGCDDVDNDSPNQDSDAAPAVNVGDNDNDDDDDDDDRLEDLCEVYCNELDANCSEPDLLQYEEGSCQTVCEVYLLPKGPNDDADEDTIECRTSEASTALLEPESCSLAGLSGDDGCGDICEVYCRLVESRCGVQYELMFNNDENECENACFGVPRAEKAFDQSMQTGNTLECRFYHLQAAALGGLNNSHCEHSVGLALCVD